MRKYRNMRTGAVIETDCRCSGKEWQEETPATDAAGVVKEKKTNKRKGQNSE